MPLGIDVGLSSGDFLLDGDPAPPPSKGAEFPIFGPRLLWQNGCMDQDALGAEAGLGLRDILLDSGPASPPLKGHSPQFSANVRCGQTTRWTEMPLGMQVGLGPCDFVFDGDPATPRKKGTPKSHLIFGPCLLWPNGWMDQDATWYRGKPRHSRWGRIFPLKGAQAPVFGSCLLWQNGWMDEVATWYGSRRQPRPHCIRRGPSSPRKGHSSPPLFGRCLLWPWSPISATAEVLCFSSWLDKIINCCMWKQCHHKVDKYQLSLHHGNHAANNGGCSA